MVAAAVQHMIVGSHVTAMLQNTTARQPANANVAESL
jgi:hypothetical protein